MSGSDIDIVRGAYEAFNRGDQDGAVACFADDAVLDLSQRLLDPIVVEGHDGIRWWVREFGGAWRQWWFEMHRVLEPEAGVIVVDTTLHTQGQTTGVATSAKAAHRFSMRAGRIARMTLYQTLDEALEADS